MRATLDDRRESVKRTWEAAGRLSSLRRAGGQWAASARLIERHQPRPLGPQQRRAHRAIRPDRLQQRRGRRPSGGGRPAAPRRAPRAARGWSCSRPAARASAVTASRSTWPNTAWSPTMPASGTSAREPGPNSGASSGSASTASTSAASAACSPALEAERRQREVGARAPPARSSAGRPGRLCSRRWIRSPRRKRPARAACSGETAGVGSSASPRDGLSGRSPRPSAGAGRRSQGGGSGSSGGRAASASPSCRGPPVPRIGEAPGLAREPRDQAHRDALRALRARARSRPARARSVSLPLLRSQPATIRCSRARVSPT